MKFEYNCKTEKGFKKMLDEIHLEKNGVSFEVGARLWYTFNEKTVMVEHQISTAECTELTGEYELDWLTAYAVDNENDDDCSNEIFTDTIENNIKLVGLKNAMLDFAKMVLENYNN